MACSRSVLFANQPPPKTSRMEMGRRASRLEVDTLRNVRVASGNRRNCTSFEIMANRPSRSTLDVLVDHVHHGILSASARGFATCLRTSLFDPRRVANPCFVKTALSYSQLTLTQFPVLVGIDLIDQNCS